MRRLLWGALLVALAFSASRASADSTTFTATQQGANEVPPVASSATGFANLTLDSTAMTLQIIETFSGLTTPASFALIHCCSGAGANADVALFLPGFPIATSGLYTNSIDLTDSTSYNPAFLAANGGTAALAEAALSAGLFDGLAYINIHDTEFPGGEIRGQFAAATAAVPEPATLTLLGLGLASLGAKLRRRRA